MKVFPKVAEQARDYSLPTVASKRELRVDFLYTIRAQNLLLLLEIISNSNNSID